jgi:DNA-directed RNA polymerase specialized sigma24 family protein
MNYLCGIAQNIVRDLKKAKKEYPCPPKQIETLMNVLISSKPPEILTDPLETAELFQVIQVKIRQLPPKSRQAMELVFMESEEHQKSLRNPDSCSSDVFRMRLHHAIKLLREKLSNP